MKYLEITYIDGSEDIIDLFTTVEIYRDDNDEVFIVIEGKHYYYSNIDIIYLNDNGTRSKCQIDNIVLNIKKGETITFLDVCDEVDMEILGY